MSELRSSSDESWLQRRMQRAMSIEPDEIKGALLSFAYFFAVLCAYYIIRPVRDEMGVTVGQAGLERLFTIVFFVMLAAVPLFGWVVSQFEKRRIVPYVYAFFIANLLAFWVALEAGGGHAKLVASAFFVWASVFNLFVVSMFWILMSDLWRTDQARRLYGFIAAGGSFGAFSGPLLTQSLVKITGPTNLLLISAGLLMLAVLAAMRLRKLFEGKAGASDGGERLTGRGILAGAEAVWRSPYLFRIALWILLANVVSTFFYFEQTRIVGETIPDRAGRVQLFARLDLAVSVLTILAQLFLTARVLDRLGVAATAALLPAIAVVGLVALSIAPVLGVIVTVMALERAVAFALANPAVKTLYTAVDPEEKYKAQSFIDTVVYRGGDAMSGWMFGALSKGLGFGAATIALVTLPIALAWLATSRSLGGKPLAPKN